MGRRYRRRRNDDTFDIVALGVLAACYSIYEFLRKYWIEIIIVFLILLFIFLIVKYNKEIKAFFSRKYINKLKRQSLLYEKIKELNSRYNLSELYDFIDYYSVSTKSGLNSANIDDYLLMTINNKYDQLVEYKRNYDKLIILYKEYLKEYNDIHKYISIEEAGKIGMSLKKYNKYQNEIYEAEKMKRTYQFKVLICINYSSKKGKVRKSKSHIYYQDEFMKIMKKYREIQNTQEINQISSRIERARMSDSIRYDVLRRDNYKCAICGKGNRDGVKLEVDHIIPVSKGGKTEMSNLQTLCERCNRGKSNKL